MKKLLLPAIFAVALFCALPAWSTPATGNQDDVAKIENYLNGIGTMRARFTQITSDGSESTGDFFLKRPGRLRFEYDPPVRDFIVADGRQIHFYDSLLEQKSSADISDTIADFFLRRNLKLGEDIHVESLFKEENRVLLTLTQAAAPENGQLILILDREPLQLRKWQIRDAKGGTTEITLSHVTTGVDISDKKFRYTDPNASDYGGLN